MSADALSVFPSRGGRTPPDFRPLSGQSPQRSMGMKAISKWVESDLELLSATGHKSFVRFPKRNYGPAPQPFCARGRSLDKRKTRVSHPACAFVGLLLFSSVAAVAADPSAPTPAPTHPGSSRRRRARPRTTRRWQACLCLKHGWRVSKLHQPGTQLRFRPAAPPRSCERGRPDRVRRALRRSIRLGAALPWSWLLPMPISSSRYTWSAHPSRKAIPSSSCRSLTPPQRCPCGASARSPDPAELQKHRDANFERAMTRLVQDMKTLFARADAPGLFHEVEAVRSPFGARIPQLGYSFDWVTRCVLVRNRWSAPDVGT